MRDQPKVGDRVRILADWSPHRGLTGEVTRAERSNGGPYLVYRVHFDDGHNGAFVATELAKVTWPPF